MNEYFEFNGRYYAIDMDKFIEFVAESKNNEKDNSTVITQVFADNEYEDEEIQPKEQSLTSFKAVSKEITENKSNTNPVFNNIRYDFAKILLSTLVSPFYNQDGSFVIASTEEDLFLGQKIAFNTLLNKGIIFEISE